MKVCVIGGGSTYTPELVSGFLDRAEAMGLDELCLMDIDERRLDIVGGFARRMAEAAGARFSVSLETDRSRAIRGSDFVATQYRVGQMEARRGDEYLGRRHGLVGQETTGVGGMANALRTVPVALDIARDAARLAPRALIVNFANPSGLVAQALADRAPEVASVGVCNVGITASMKLRTLYGRLSGDEPEPGRVVLETLGLNHLTWHRGFYVDGTDRWPELFPVILDELEAEGHPGFDRRTLEILGMLPNYYLKYFYYTSRMVAEQAAWPPSRAEEVMRVEKTLLERYADPGLREAPPELMERGGAYYSQLATKVIADYAGAPDPAGKRGGVHVVNVPNRGAVPSWPSDWVLELPARVDDEGVRPLPSRPLPPAQFALVAAVKSYELLTIEAAVSGDRKAAYEALLAHPLGPEADRAGAVLDDMLETNRAWLPAFFGGSKA